MKEIMTFNYEVKQAKSTIMLRATMTLLMVVMTSASAWADTSYSYITDLMLIGKNNKTEANALKEQYVEQGWTAIDQDLNAGCGPTSSMPTLTTTCGNRNKNGLIITTTG